MKRAFLLISFILIFITTASAVDIIEKQAEILDVDELVESAPNDVDIEINEDTSLDKGLKGLGQRIKNEIGHVFTRSLSCIGVVIAVSVLSALLGSIQGDALKKAPGYMNAVSAIAISAAASGNINTFVSMANTAIDSMSKFSTVLFPALSASVAASGSPVGAVVRHSASVLFSGTFISLINSVLVPLLYTYIGTATANAAISNSSLDKICSFLEWVISGSLKVILTVFLAYISVSGFVASTGDAAGVKTLSTLSGAVPVVGGILTNATGAVLAGAKVLKNSIGIFGLISVMSICLTPCLVLSVNYFVFKAASAILAPVCDAKTGDLVAKIGTSFGMMLAITASCALLLFIAIISCMFAMGIS